MRFQKSLCVALSIALGASALPASAFAIQEGDQTPLTSEEIAAYIEQGSDGTNFEDEAAASNAAINLASNSSSVRSSKTNSAISTNTQVYAYSGDDMFETAAMEAVDAYPNGSTSAIIAGPGGAWVDALTSAGLSSAKGPILFAGDGYLPSQTIDALNDLGVQSVVIVGGEAAVKPGVVSDLQSNGFSIETRLAGDDCFGTQMAIYNYGVEHNVWDTDYVFVATYAYFADALSASPIAYSAKAPIFIVDGNGGLNAEQTDALLEKAQQGWFKNPVVFGGSTVVSERTLGKLDGIAHIAGSESGAIRLWGSDMYGTSEAVAAWSVNSMGFNWNSPTLATGKAPYDALAGSVLAGSLKSPLLLVDDDYTDTIEYAANSAGSIPEIRFLGGEACISMRTRMNIADDLGFPWAAIPGYKVYVDAGHGYNDQNNGRWDSGAIGCGYCEADLTKELANMVASILTNTYGIDVFLNDDGGYYKLRHAEAINAGCDSLVSIHFNAANGGSGTESYIHEYNASDLSASWQNSIHPCLVAGTGLKDRGAKTAELAIVGGYLPSVLLEICFIDNSYDMNQYQARKYFIATEIAEGIVSR